MMNLPVVQKPVNTHDYSSLVTEIPNILSNDEIERLKFYAKDSGTSGWHRRGSKDKNTNASFYTCQVYRTDDPIYQILSSYWNQYLKQNNYSLSFIEPYEIKSYGEGDEFEYHNDAYINVSKNIDRKLNLIVQMSDSDEYSGGDLFIGNHVCSRTKGTGIFFPAALFHKVTKITSGTRFSMIGHGWAPYFT